MNVIIINQHYSHVWTTIIIIIRIRHDLSNHWLNVTNEGCVYNSSSNLDHLIDSKEEDDNNKNNNNDDDYNDVDCINIGG